MLYNLLQILFIIFGGTLIINLLLSIVLLDINNTKTKHTKILKYNAIIVMIIILTFIICHKLQI